MERLSHVRLVVLCLITHSATLAAAQKPAIPLPEQFVVGRNSFFDFGPPFNYYEVISVQPEQTGSRIERILITPPGHACTAPAQFESKTVTIPESVPVLLEGGNPCAIPEKELRKELKRCKNCLVFSGVRVAMRATCANAQRQIRMDILDRNIYGSVRMPEHTNWTANLLRRLDEALGPGVMDKPAFSREPETPAVVPRRSKLLDDLAAGKYDTLFEGSQDKLSALIAQAEHPPSNPSVELVDSSPIRPASSNLPGYPPIAKAAHVSGQVRISGTVTIDGRLTNLKTVGGHPLLQKTTLSAVTEWVYPKEYGGKEVQVTIEFRLNCAAAKQ